LPQQDNRPVDSISKVIYLPICSSYNIMWLCSVAI